MKTYLHVALAFVLAATLASCATPEERKRRDDERRREDARDEAERRERIAKTHSATVNTVSARIDMGTAGVTGIRNGS